MTQVEQRLAELLNVAAPTSEGVAFDDVVRRVRRRRTVLWSGIATTTTIAAVVATVSLVGVPGIGRSSRLEQPSRPVPTPSVDLSGAVPWIDTPASPYQPPTASPTSPAATDARACTAGDVAASLADRNGAGGHTIRYVRFRNTSRSTCVLKGYPQVTATEPGLPIVAGTNGSFFASPGTANMPPGQDTLLGLETDTECPARPDGGGGKPPYHRISIRLPGGGSVRLDDPSRGFDITCGLHLTQFFVQQPEQPQPPDPLSDLQVSLVAPATVSAGTTLIYAVDLSNPTDRPISLTPCPGYTEAAGTTVKESYALNCASAGAIAAHHTIRFEMRMRIPARTPAGSLVIRWALDGGNVASGATVNVATTPAPAQS